MESEVPSNRKDVNKPNPRAKEETAKIEKVVVGEVITRKKPLGRRFAETFLGGNLRNASDYVLFEVLIPAAKDALADGFSQGAERFIFGEVRSTSRRGGYRTAGQTAYHRISNANSAARDRREDPRERRRARASHNFDEFILASRAEAVEVLDRLHLRIEKYDFATVLNLYEMLGEEGEYTDNKWGWTDLSKADVIRVSNGYLLDLPRPEPVN